jgi:hypothetical protein
LWCCCLLEEPRRALETEALWALGEWAKVLARVGLANV